MERIQTLPEPVRQIWEVVAGLYNVLPAFEQDQYAMLGGGTLPGSTMEGRRAAEAK